MTKPGKLLDRLGQALAPPRQHLQPLLFEAAWLLPVLLALGMAGGLMQWQPRWDATILGLAVVAIFAPALGEELLFRVALLPIPRPNSSLPMRPLVASVALFVAWHPLQIVVFGSHWAKTVLDPWFLAAVAAFGVASARLYWKTASVWPSTVLHWLVVVGWKALLSGPSPWLPS